MNKDNPPKAQEVDETYVYESPNNYYHNDNYNAPSQSQGHRPFTGQGGNQQFRIYNETEAKDLNIVNISFRVFDIREVHPNKTVLNMVITVNPIFREIKQIATEVEAMAGVLSILEDAVVVGPTIRIAMEHTSIIITPMTHRQNSMAHPAVYAVVSIILLSIATKENMI